MGKTSQTKTLALAVSAIQNLEEVRGSTSRDIANHITRVHGVNKDSIKKQVQSSLKRGLAYGILKRNDGHYSLVTEADDASKEIASQEIGLIDMCSRKRGARRGSRRIRKSRRSGNNCKRCGRSCPCAAGTSENRKNRGNKGSGAPGKAVIDSNKLSTSTEVEELFGVGGSLRNLKKTGDVRSLSSDSRSVSENSSF